MTCIQFGFLVFLLTGGRAAAAAVVVVIYSLFISVWCACVNEYVDEMRHINSDTTEIYIFFFVKFTFRFEFDFLFRFRGVRCV